MNDPERTEFQPESPDSPAVHAARPQHLGRHIGRYRVEKILGQGGFGLVYLAHDQQLQRYVAIKVPHPRLISQPSDAEAYLTEARTVANLDHPHIVSVFDVGSTEDCPCFIVSKFIEGSTLAQKIKDDRPTFGETTELIATIAEALHYAHCKGLVHRDIKPGNILLDAGGKPFVVDFGLALKEENVGQGPKYAGTPAYMSPEQARGEGHRVDGRSDIFSLGVVFYELLVGRQPFRAGSQAALLEQITSFEPRPPRQYDDNIPKELDRICLKALSKRASERYSTAKDMADDLRAWSVVRSPLSVAIVGKESPTTVPGAPSATDHGPRTTDSKTADLSQPIKIVPKGLRSFDAHDADFFLELLSGPRDREGLPDSIRFWKTRIEEKDPDSTFSVGLVYGPSGCGKSSLVKAGLLPRLSDDVMAVYLEATDVETEIRLLHGLRKRCPSLADNLGLKETLAALRRGQGIPLGKKVVIILDQFEQWLHAKKEEQNTELVQALRQCDGGRVQGVVMVRDDFWMAATRFMRELEVRLLEGQNSAAVDLFDLDHGRRVLAAFGRAFGKLLENSSETNKEEKEFLKQAVHGLAQEGKIICVRLALFAEMMKGKPWMPATLKEMGGTEGVGVTFLEETFSASTAPPEHRYHQKAARAVLNALLPESGTDIKGHMRSHDELLQASGYGNRPKDFDDLIRILDSEIRLITPTDPEAYEPEALATGPASPVANEPVANASGSYTSRFYQLTHDYLVPSLRDWLTRKQKETRRGLAELLLADRAAVWNARPENRQLPSLLQWLQIRWLAQKKNWTPPQRKMMRKAGRHHVVRGLVGMVLVALIGWGGYEAHGTLKAHALRDRLLDAHTNEVPTIVQDMAPYRRWIDPLLRISYQEPEADLGSRKRLHSSLALLPVDRNQKEYLYTRLLDATAQDVLVLRDALAPHKDDLLDKLWTVVEQPAKGQERQRLRAAYALAAYDPEGQRWEKTKSKVVDDLVSVNPVFLGLWSEGFRPIQRRLVEPLSNIFRERQAERTAERTLATNLLADCAADQPEVLADLLLDADEKQFAVLYLKLKDHGERALTLLQGAMDTQLPPNAQEEGKEKLAKRQANAAVALLKMNQPAKVWPLLKHSADPRVRSYLIHRFGPLGADARAVVQRLDEEPDVTIQRALILSLGEFGEEAWLPDERTVLLKKMQDVYRTAHDPGLHAAAEWLLRQSPWKHEEWLLQTNEAWAKDKKEREKRLQVIKEELSKEMGKARPQWYVNGQGQTMVVIPGPVKFLMGSPPTEKGRFEPETQHWMRIGQTFAMAAKPVTVAEYRRFNKSHKFTDRYAPTPDCPVITISWHAAAAYCNWLSEQEGIPPAEWCYEIDPNGQVTRLKEKYLSLTSYRLPTEAEMEYATRAGAVTSRYYGETEELLPHYGWYIQNSEDRTWPVGRKKPNDLGLFDMYGNVWNWCQERLIRSERPVEDLEDTLMINPQENRVMRGGSFIVRPWNMRSANFDWNVPTLKTIFVGFRAARTLAVK